jgi:hypothetical protein
MADRRSVLTSRRSDHRAPWVSRRCQLLALLVAVLGCSGPEDAAGEEAPSFLAISRVTTGDSGTDMEARAERLSQLPAGELMPGDAFYLAIHRRELANRWFMSAYLKQFFPGAVLAGAAKTLGTRVVSLKVQNGRLYVLDVDERKEVSDTFTQDVIVEAYPIVDPRGLALGRAVSSDYVVVDPSAGLNRFGVVGDLYGSGGMDRFMVELVLSQRFRELTDGMTFEQVFTGYSELARPNMERVENNFFRGSGVLGLAFRRYREGAGFTATPPPPVPHYFLVDNRLVPNTGRVAQQVAKWNIHQGMEPIKWLISPVAQQAATADPDLRAAGVDLVRAIASGIESWNTAFGFRVLQAERARPDDSFADDDKNYFIYDVNPANGSAFANIRTNPNTGEIRGASVYFSHFFAAQAVASFKETAPPLPPMADGAAAPRVSLAWAAMLPGDPPCDIGAFSLAPVPGDPAAVPGTLGEKVERVVSHLVAHEVGHTLGLRHNFKGSLVAPSSSVMDYLSNALEVQGEVPRAYDIDAIRYLYGLSSALPTQPFCTDTALETDARCAKMDGTADPLVLYYAPPYGATVTRFLTTGDASSGTRAEQLLNELARFIRVGATPEERLAAWNIAIDKLRVPAPAPPAATSPASYAAGVNRLWQEVVIRLVPVPPDPNTPEAAALARNPPPRPLDPAILEALVVELKGTLVNADGIRSFPKRRLAVDTLRRLQRVDASQALSDARTALGVQSMNSTTPADRVQLDDLAARVERALSPYFDR